MCGAQEPMKLSHSPMFSRATAYFDRGSHDVFFFFLGSSCWWGTGNLRLIPTPD